MSGPRRSGARRGLVAATLMRVPLGILTDPLTVLALLPLIEQTLPASELERLPRRLRDDAE